jgi:hypothetical protein
MQDAARLTLACAVDAAAELCQAAAKALLRAEQALDRLALRLVPPTPDDWVLDPETMDDMATVIALANKRPRLQPSCIVCGHLGEAHHPACPGATV